jgi:hypothetical protein
MITMTEHEWRAKGAEIFGDDMSLWRFVCPACKHVASAQDWHDAGASDGTIGYSCIGRWTGSNRGAFDDGQLGPCNYAGGGLIGLNPIKVVFDNGKSINVFAFDESTPDSKEATHDPA